MIFFLPKLKFRKYPKPKGWGFCKSGLERERERERENPNHCWCIAAFLWVVLLQSYCGHCCILTPNRCLAAFFVGCVVAFLLWALLRFLLLGVVAFQCC